LTEFDAADGIDVVESFFETTVNVYCIPLGNPGPTVPDIGTGVAGFIAGAVTVVIKDPGVDVITKLDGQTPSVGGVNVMVAELLVSFFADTIVGGFTVVLPTTLSVPDPVPPTLSVPDSVPPTLSVPDPVPPTVDVLKTKTHPERS
jgi:hypothetical protein